MLKPQLGDTILNRYTLVASLREEPGIKAWKTNDRVLAKDCQLFIVTDRTMLGMVSMMAGQMAATKPQHHTPVLKYRMQDNVLIMVMPLDEGMSLTEYFGSGQDHALSYGAMRSILGETASAMRSIISFAATTDTVRLTASGVEVADAPLTPLLSDTTGLNGVAATERYSERYAVRQLAALLYAMLTRTPSHINPRFDLNSLPADTPSEFQVICKRGLELFDSSDNGLPMAALAELEALLGDWKPLSELSNDDITLPTSNGVCSIVSAIVKPAQDADMAEIPSSLITSDKLPDLSIDQNLPASAVLPTVNLAGAVSEAKSAVEPNGNPLPHRFDFTLPDDLQQAWHNENLSGEDTGDWFNNLNPSLQPGTAVPDATEGETTSRIPVFDANGRPIAPGEESARALAQEQERINEVNPVPPSFTPQEPPAQEDDKLPDETLFGNMSTKVVAIVVAALVVVLAGIWASHAFKSSSLNPDDPSASSTTEGAWPELDMNAIPFGDEQDNKSEASDNKRQQSDNATKSDKDAKPVVKDREASAVPQPRHENTTPFTIASSNFLHNPGGQSGYAYYMHLDQPHDVYRMMITIRTSGGTGYIRANTNGDPTQGEEVAQFTFAEGGTTEVKFTKIITTQDLILWVPVDSMPQNQLYIEKVEIF